MLEYVESGGAERERDRGIEQRLFSFFSTLCEHALQSVFFSSNKKTRSSLSLSLTFGFALREIKKALLRGE
jgi:hypothetical protein